MSLIAKPKTLILFAVLAATVTYSVKFEIPLRVDVPYNSTTTVPLKTISPDNTDDSFQYGAVYSLSDNSTQGVSFKQPFDYQGKYVNETALGIPVTNEIYFMGYDYYQQNWNFILEGNPENNASFLNVKYYDGSLLNNTNPYKYDHRIALQGNNTKYIGAGLLISYLDISTVITLVGDKLMLTAYHVEEKSRLELQIGQLENPESFIDPQYSLACAFSTYNKCIGYVWSRGLEQEPPRGTSGHIFGFEVNFKELDFKPITPLTLNTLIGDPSLFNARLLTLKSISSDFEVVLQIKQQGLDSQFRSAKIKDDSSGTLGGVKIMPIRNDILGGSGHGQSTNYLDVFIWRYQINFKFYAKINFIQAYNDASSPLNISSYNGISDDKSQLAEAPNYCSLDTEFQTRKIYPLFNLGEFIEMQDKKSFRIKLQNQDSPMICLTLDEEPIHWFFHPLKLQLVVKDSIGTKIYSAQQSEMSITANDEVGGSRNFQIQSNYVGGYPDTQKLKEVDVTMVQDPKAMKMNTRNF